MAGADTPQIPAPPIHRILEAARFAAEKHAQQKRKGKAGEPYVNHLLEVAELIAGSGDLLDVNLVIAGLLHDTVEDVDVTFADLEKKFGPDVSSLVAEVTDDKSLPKEVRKALQIQTAPKKTPRAQVIKLADKISNLRALLDSPPSDWSAERRRQYFDWAQQVVGALSAPNSVLKAEFDRTCARFK